MWALFDLQLTLKQHRFELHGSPYVCGLFSLNTSPALICGWESADAESQLCASICALLYSRHMPVHFDICGGPGATHLWVLRDNVSLQSLGSQK